MLLIGIESSALVASVALVRDDTLIAEYTMNNTKTHSQTLLPMLDEIVRASGIEMKDVDAIAISRGPGSFTGLRIGSATAKGLGLALDKPVVEVPTLDALAYNLYGISDAVICPIMDARRQEVYSGIYDFRAEEGKRGGSLVMNTLSAESAGPLADVLEELNRIGRPVIFLGDGVPVYAELIAQKLNVSYSFAPGHVSRQRAASVAMLGVFMAQKGQLVSAAEHAPVYLRVSQAEREKKAREEDNTQN